MVKPGLGPVPAAAAGRRSHPCDAGPRGALRGAGGCGAADEGARSGRGAATGDHCWGSSVVNRYRVT